MYRWFAVAAAGLFFVMPARAMDLQQMQLAGGLIEILKKADPCGYSVDDSALENY